MKKRNRLLADIETILDLNDIAGSLSLKKPVKVKKYRYLKLERAGIGADIFVHYTVAEEKEVYHCDIILLKNDELKSILAVLPIPAFFEKKMKKISLEFQHRQGRYR